MKYGRKISSGIVSVGVVFAVGFGALLALGLIFGESATWWSRILFALLAVWAFATGFMDGNVDETPDEEPKNLEERKQIGHAYDARKYIVLSALLLTFSKNGGVLRGLLPDEEADVLYDMGERLDHEFTAAEQLAMLAELIREKSAEVLRIGEDDAA
ncbi:hypothetical protein ACIFQM_11180 [Paenibacillus sp. NRS-1782]|uniref:hypothetical protein n=1 Tax=unclassified Paenibacillus TaxID=185978 RepID=UPI003D28778E